MPALSRFSNTLKISSLSFHSGILLYRLVRNGSQVWQAKAFSICWTIIM